MTPQLETLEPRCQPATLSVVGSVPAAVAPASEFSVTVQITADASTATGLGLLTQWYGEDDVHLTGITDVSQNKLIGVAQRNDHEVLGAWLDWNWPPQWLAANQTVNLLTLHFSTDADFDGAEFTFGSTSVPPGWTLDAPGFAVGLAESLASQSQSELDAAFASLLAENADVLAPALPDTVGPDVSLLAAAPAAGPAVLGAGGTVAARALTPVLDWGTLEMLANPWTRKAI